MADPHNPQLSSIESTTASMASEYYSVMLEALNITCHQLTLPTTMVVPVPVRPVNETRPFSRGALILKAITPLRENRVWPRETRSPRTICGAVSGPPLPQMVPLKLSLEMMSRGSYEVNLANMDRVIIIVIYVSLCIASCSS